MQEQQEQQENNNLLFYEKKDKRFTMRISQTEYEYLVQEAKKNNLKASQYVSSILFKNLYYK